MTKQELIDYVPAVIERGSDLLTSEAWKKRREELLDLMAVEEYGFEPAIYGETQGRVIACIDKCCAGHARVETVEISFPTEKGNYSFPMHFFVPTDGQRHPLFLLINFRPDLYDMYYPAEEIIDQGFALAVIDYQKVTSDDGDMENGLAGEYSGKNPCTDPGKLSFWAFACSRAVDYLMTRPEVDEKNMAVIGHSRLGKTALLCGARDERIRFALANDAGCGGDAIEHTKHAQAETIEFMNQTFPFWFCNNRKQYAGREKIMSWDQHFLMACIAPRYVATAAAEQDLWADPLSQQYCCTLAGEAWEAMGLKGYTGGVEPMSPGEKESEGHIGHFYRDGIHFLSRQDWLFYMEFMRRHLDITLE